MTREKAFTLVELLIVIAIIGILTVAFLPNVLSAPAKARDATRLKAVRDIVSAIEVYATEHGSPPPSEFTSCTGPTPCCFTDVTAKILGISTPKDSKKLNSCGDSFPGKPNADKFFYRFLPTPSSGSSFYVVATKMEKDSSANAFGLKTSATYITTKSGRAGPCMSLQKIFPGITTKACMQDIVNQNAVPIGSYNIPWYLEVGPK